MNTIMAVFFGHLRFRYANKISGIWLIRPSPHKAVPRKAAPKGGSEAILNIRISFILKFSESLQRYLLSRQANLAFLGQACSGQIFSHWAAATLKGHAEFQNKRF